VGLDRADAEKGRCDGAALRRGHGHGDGASGPERNAT
jgi:hypothetical protein